MITAFGGGMVKPPEREKMGTKQDGWTCHSSVLKSGNWTHKWDRFKTQKEANEAGQRFLEGINSKTEEAREYEIYKHFE